MMQHSFFATIFPVMFLHLLALQFLRVIAVMCAAAFDDDAGSSTLFFSSISPQHIN
jgi:hypothetical protein